MPGTGTTTVDFGSAPGRSVATAVVTGQTGIVAGSRVGAWLEATATPEHTADEHVVEELDVVAGSIVAATGFTIYAKTRNVALTGRYTVGWAWT